MASIESKTSTTKRKSGQDDEEDKTHVKKQKLEECSDDDDDIPLSKRFAPEQKVPVGEHSAAVADDSDSDDDTPLAQRFAVAPSPAAGSDDVEDEDDDDGDADESASDAESESDDDAAPRRRRNATPSKSRAKAAGAKASARKTTSEKLQDPRNYEMRAEATPLQPSKGANKWWNRPLAKDIKWETLEHNGVLFPPAYVPHGVRMKYDGKPVELTAEQEEVATMYATMLETDYAKSDVFNKNFFADWRKLLGKGHVIQSLDKCDFRPIYDHVVAERDAKKAANKEPEIKKKNKAETERIKATYGVAIVDGYLEKVGNFRVEPPGLFRGRGKHPKAGMLKRRVQPEDIVINIGKGVPIPKCPDGHNWKGIVHDPTVTWLAFWRDNINGQYKYVFLASSSRFKGESDMKKYGQARKLKLHIDRIRANYNQELSGKTLIEQQRATAIYLIDVLALRVGNEKDTKEEADTVGCCSLRVEHLTFHDDCKVEFDFLGKDSMRYHNVATVDKRVYRNLKEFCKGKRRDEDIFDRLTTTSLNDHLKSLMPGLSAKVFRTYNASHTLQQELFYAKELVDEADPEGAKALFYTKANTTVAILCNHQRSVPKAFEAQMGKLGDKVQEIQAQRDELQQWLDFLTKKSKKKPPELAEGKKRPTDPERVRAQIARLDIRLENHRTKMKLKDNTKTVALGTSKINYMDPRISVAWCKTFEYPVEKIFNRSLLDKFPWAMEVEPDWRF